MIAALISSLDIHEKVTFPDRCKTGPFCNSSATHTNQRTVALQNSVSECPKRPISRLLGIG